MSKATEILELFEELLQEKGIEIPCDDEEEQRVRYDGENDAKLYGMEYWGLADKIEELLATHSPASEETDEKKVVYVLKTFERNDKYCNYDTNIVAIYSPEKYKEGKKQWKTLCKEFMEANKDECKDENFELDEYFRDKECYFVYNNGLCDRYCAGHIILEERPIV